MKRPGFRSQFYEVFRESFLFMCKYIFSTSLLTISYFTFRYPISFSYTDFTISSLQTSDFSLQTSDLITFYVIRLHSFAEAMSETHESSILEYAERNIMMDNMLSDKILNEDYIKFLKDQINAYMIELSHKNEQIISLIKLFEKNVNKTNMMPNHLLETWNAIMTCN